MEQNNQQINQKPSLPTKTKIAAWWMIISCICIISYGSWVLSRVLTCKGGELFNVYILSIGLISAILMIFFGLLYFISALFLLKNKKLGWWLGVIVSLILIYFFKVILLFYEESASSLSLFQFIGHLDFLVYSFVIPFILLLLDRKNFWKIAS